MNNQNSPIPEDIASEVFKVASEMYAEAQSSYSVSELQEAGKEVNIPPEIIEKALAKVQQEKLIAKQEAIAAQKRKKTAMYVGGAIASLAVLWGIFTFNSLSSAEQKVNANWAQVENQLQRRSDLIPRLVNLVNAQSQQEKEVIQLLERSRDNYLKAETPSDKLRANQDINQALERFEQYFGTSQAYINLQYEIAGTENRIATERKRFNDAVQMYNRPLAKVFCDII